MIVAWQAEEFGHVAELLFQRIARCLTSSHFQVGDIFVHRFVWSQCTTPPQLQLSDAIVVYAGCRT